MLIEVERPNVDAHLVLRSSRAVAQPWLIACRILQAAFAANTAAPLTAHLSDVVAAWKEAMRAVTDAPPEVGPERGSTLGTTGGA